MNRPSEASSHAGRTDPTRDAAPRLHRRAMLGGAGLGLAGLLAANRPQFQATARQAATPVASPFASPIASPVASPVSVPAGAPEATTGLRIIRDQRPTYADEPVAGGELRLPVRSTELLAFNPAAFRQDGQVPVSYLDPLVRVDEVTLEPQPWLAERWEWRDSGRELVLTLRPDVTWHDGTLLSPEDVCFSFFVYRDDFDSAVTGFFAVMRTCAPEGQRTVRVLLDDPDGAFLFNAATMPIFQRAQYRDHWDVQPTGERSLNRFDWASNPPVGTGPWRVVEMRERALHFTRHDDYWAGPAHAENLRLIAQDDPTARLAAWRAGELDVLWPIRSRDVPALADETGFIFTADAPVAMFAAFNFINPARAAPDMLVFPELRQALNLAIDRAAYAQADFGGFVAETRTGTVAQPWAHDDSMANPRRDVAEAKRVLDALGWVDVTGDGLRDTPWGEPLSLVCIVQDDTRPELLALLDRLNADLGDIGAALEVQRLDAATFADRWINGHDFDLIAYALTLYPGFAEYDLYGSAWDIRTNPRGWNPGGYVNATVDEAIAAYLAAVEQEDMAAALATLQRAVNDDLFALWFGFPQDLILVRPDIRGFIPNKMHQTADTRLLWRTPVS